MIAEKLFGKWNQVIVWMFMLQMCMHSSTTAAVYDRPAFYSLLVYLNTVVANKPNSPKTNF